MGFVNPSHGTLHVGWSAMSRGNGEYCANISSTRWVDLRRLGAKRILRGDILPLQTSPIVILCDYLFPGERLPFLYGFAFVRTGWRQGRTKAAEVSAGRFLDGRIVAPNFRGTGRALGDSEGLLRPL